MGGPDYYRYHLDLITHDEVEFPDQSTMMDFVAKLVAEEYKSFVLLSMVTKAITMEDFELYSQRECSEPTLVEMYVKSYIKSKFAENDTVGKKLKAKFKHLSWPLDVQFDAETHAEMYDFILGKLRQGDRAEDVFVSGYTYTIVEGKKLRRTTI